LLFHGIDEPKDGCKKKTHDENERFTIFF